MCASVWEGSMQSDLLSLSSTRRVLAPEFLFLFTPIP